MKTRMLIVRHGATVLSAEDRFAGSTDVPLGDDGRVHAERLARRLAGEAIAAVYSSPLRRTIETAAIVARPHGLVPIPHDGLREIDHGRWEGLRRTEVEARYPEEYAAWESDPLTYAPPGGETGQHVLDRALVATREIVRDNPDRTVLVVSHKATIRLIVASVLGFDPRRYRDRLDQQPACLNVIDFDERCNARLMLFNDVSHHSLPPIEARAALASGNVQ